MFRMQRPQHTAAACGFEGSGLRFRIEAVGFRVWVLGFGGFKWVVGWIQGPCVEGSWRVVGRVLHEQQRRRRAPLPP